MVIATRQAMYVQHNTEGRWCNHSCIGKAKVLHILSVYMYNFRKYFLNIKFVF